jgi:hypothetical protein
MAIERIACSVGLSGAVLAPSGRGKETQLPKMAEVSICQRHKKECPVVLIQLLLYIFHATDSLTCPYYYLIVHNVLIMRFNHYLVQTTVCFGYP